MTEDRFVTYQTSKENNHVEEKGTVGAVVASFCIDKEIYMDYIFHNQFMSLLLEPNWHNKII